MTGSLKFVEGDYNLIGYGRFTREGQSLILVNNNDYEVTKEWSIWYLGIPKECVLIRLMMTTAEGYSTEAKEYPVTSGKVKVVLPPTSAVILRHENHIERSFPQFH